MVTAPHYTWRSGTRTFLSPMTSLEGEGPAHWQYMYHVLHVTEFRGRVCIEQTRDTCPPSTHTAHMCTQCHTCTPYTHMCPHTHHTHVHIYIYTTHTHTHSAYSCEVDLKSLKPEATHDIKLHLKGADRMDAGAIHVLLVITGTAVEEEDVDGREEHAALESTPGDINMSDVRKRYVSVRWGGGMCLKLRSHGSSCSWSIGSDEDH